MHREIMQAPALHGHRPLDLRSSGVHQLAGPLEEVGLTDRQVVAVPATVVKHRQE